MLIRQLNKWIQGWDYDTSLIVQVSYQLCQFLWYSSWIAAVECDHVVLILASFLSKNERKKGKSNIIDFLFHVTLDWDPSEAWTLELWFFIRLISICEEWATRSNYIRQIRIFITEQKSLANTVWAHTKSYWLHRYNEKSIIVI